MSQANDIARDGERSIPPRCSPFVRSLTDAHNAVVADLRVAVVEIQVERACDERHVVWLQRRGEPRGVKQHRRIVAVRDENDGAAAATVQRRSDARCGKTAQRAVARDTKSVARHTRRTRDETRQAEPSASTHTHVVASCAHLHQSRWLRSAAAGRPDVAATPDDPAQSNQILRVRSNRTQASHTHDTSVQRARSSPLACSVTRMFLMSSLATKSKSVIVCVSSCEKIFKNV